MIINDPWNRTYGGLSGSGLNPVAASRGAVYPFAGQRYDLSGGIPSMFAGQTPEQKRMDDAQYVKFANNPGAAPFVAATGRTANLQARTPIPLETARRGFASGEGVGWTGSGWGAPEANSRGGPQYPTGVGTEYGDRYALWQTILNNMNKPIGTPALNSFNQQFGNPQNSNSNSTYRPLWG